MKSPVSLANDNWIGYVQDWVYEQEVTWMEKTVASPHWTGLTVFTIGAKGQEANKTKSNRHFLPGTRTRFNGVKADFLNSERTEHKAPSTKHRAPRAKHRAPGVEDKQTGL